MFVVFDTVNLYICVYMTSSKSYCLCDTLMDPSNVCMCVCMYLWRIIQLRRKKIMKDHVCPWAAWFQILLNTENNTA